MARGLFWDLNVILSSEQATAGDLQALVVTAKEAGFRGIALNTILTGRVDSKHRCQTRTLAESVIPSTSEAVGTVSWTPRIRPEFRVLHRLTVRVQETTDLSVFHATNEVLQTYDIVAVEVPNEKFMQQAMLLDTIDLICFPLGTRASFQLKRTQVHACAERGILFELNLGPLLSRDQMTRRYALQNSRSLCQRTGGGTRCVLVSGASSPLQMRGPKDMINLGCVLFSMPETNGVAAVSTYADYVVRHGETRRATGSKGVLWVHHAFRKAPSAGDSPAEDAAEERHEPTGMSTQTE
jgi:ribonuclease P/MRP protein subunit RPP1